MNAQYMSRLSIQDLWPHLESFLEQAGLKDAGRERLLASLELYRTRARTLKELAEAVTPYFREALDYDPEACAKFLKDPGLGDHLAALRDRYAAVPSFTKEALEAELRSLAEERQIKAGVLIHPTRMALSAAAGGPPLFDLVEVMGREAAVRHLDRFIGFLREVGNREPALQG
jgi:glutamyl-tRNA synthetase